MRNDGNDGKVDDSSAVVPEAKVADDDDDAVVPRVTRSVAKKDRVSLWGIPVLARPGLRKVEHVGTPPGSVVRWLRCDDCCQWVTFESDVAYPPAASWTCKDNTWNIQLARCFSEKEFESVYVAWWVDTFDKRPVLCSTVHGERLEFWYVYNTVTQLGGWSTVAANNWHYHVHPKSSPQQLSSLYLRYLYDFECAHFRGKRYDTKDEGAKLWCFLRLTVRWCW